MTETFKAIPDPDEDRVIKLRALLQDGYEATVELPARPARGIRKPRLVQPVSLGAAISQDHIEAPDIDVAWMADAVCSMETHDLFFPGKGRGAADAAVAICADCPVSSECLEYGSVDAVTLSAGVFGGKTAHARRQANRYRIY